MENTNETVFRSWNIGDSIGTGTDGRVSFINKVDGNGKTVTAVLKTIFFHDERNETKDFNKLGKVEANRQSEIMEILESVTGNIDIIMEIDGGKRFVRYDEYEVKPVKDGYVLYIRMEQMRSLENLLTKFSLTQDEAIQIGMSICRGLIRCRKFGYVYPNLKPENILFDERGKCKLGDFGSFSCLEPSKASIAFRKSEYYMAPEYIESGKINTTCDTYSLGLVLYMLTNRGRLPFAEPYPQVVTVNGLDNSKRERLAGTDFEKPAIASDALFEVICKACAVNPRERYLSPSQMLADLKNIAAGRPLNKPEYEEVYSNDSEAEPQPKQERQDPVAPNVKEALKDAGLPVFDASSIAPPAPGLSVDEIFANVMAERAPKPEPAPAPVPEYNPIPEPDFDTFEEGDNDYYADDSGDYSDDDGGYYDEYEEPADEEPVSLKDRIRVPNVSPRDYNRNRRQPQPKQGRKTAKKSRSRFFVGDLPQSKKENGQVADIKKLIALVAAIVVVLVLLFSSCAIRSKNKKETTPSIPAQSQVSQDAQQSSEPQSAIPNADSPSESGESTPVESGDLTDEALTGDALTGEAQGTLDETPSISQISNQ